MKMIEGLWSTRDPRPYFAEANTHIAGITRSLPSTLVTTPNTTVGTDLSLVPGGRISAGKGGECAVVIDGLVCAAVAHITHSAGRRKQVTVAAWSGVAAKALRNVVRSSNAAHGRRSGDWLSRERAGFTCQPHTRSYVIRRAYLNGSMTDAGGGVALIAANLSTPPRGAVTA